LSTVADSEPSVGSRAGEARLGGWSRAQGEPDWLREWRVNAWQTHAATPLPHRAEHLWRYSDPAEYEPAADPLAGFDAAPRPNVPLTGSPLGPTAKVTRSLCDAMRDESHGEHFGDAERVRSLLGSLVPPTFGRVEALAAATFTHGWYVRAGRGATVELPLRLEFGLENERRFGSTRSLVEIEDGAVVTLVETVRGGPTAAIQSKPALQHLHVSEVVIGANCQVQHVLVQEAGAGTQLHWTHRASVGRGSTYRPVLLSFGGLATKLDLGTLLAGERAETELSAFLCGIGRQRFDHHTVHHHLAPRTRSDLNFRTVLEGRARSAYTGLIRIESAAPFSEAYQENRNLLLSDSARAESIPELEILTQEVQCKHGATVGPIDLMQLFYLTSRGIPPTEAVRMIVSGHFEGTLRRLPDALRVSFEPLLESRLGRLQARESRGAR